MKLVASFLNMLFAPAGAYDRASDQYSARADQHYNAGPDINPASLLPMADGFTDVGGNALGFDNRHGTVGGFGGDGFDSGSDDSCFSAPMDIGDDCSGVTFYSPDIFAD